MKHESNEDILYGALDLKPGSELYLPCETEHECNVLYNDLDRLRTDLIKNLLVKYERIIIRMEPLNNYYNVVLKKRNILPAYIRKADGRKEEFPL